MKANRLDIVEPVLGQKREQRGPTALSEIQLTPRNELGAARVHTKTRKASRKRPDLKTMDDAEAYIADLESQLAAKDDQLKAAHEENRDLGQKVTKLTRQIKGIQVRAAAAIEGLE